MPGFLPATLPLPVDPRGHVGLSPLLFTAVSLTTRPASFGFSWKWNPQIRGTRESEIDQKGKTDPRGRYGAGSGSRPLGILGKSAGRRLRVSPPKGHGAGRLYPSCPEAPAATPAARPPEDKFPAFQLCLRPEKAPVARDKP